VGPRAGLDDVENRKFLIAPGLELGPLDRPASVRIKLKDVLERTNRLLYSDTTRTA
jgi:hypothetical protein